MPDGRLPLVAMLRPSSLVPSDGRNGRASARAAFKRFTRGKEERAQRHQTRDGFRWRVLIRLSGWDVSFAAEVEVA